MKSTCTSIKDEIKEGDWTCIHEWAPTALLPVLKILGTNYTNCQITTRFCEDGHDRFTKIILLYNKGCGSIEVSDGFKSEGDLIISGSTGYIYVPAPWWKTDYFEIRYEDASLNRRYYYQLDGEGIRYEIVAFARAVEQKKIIPTITKDISLSIAGIVLGALRNYAARSKV